MPNSGISMAMASKAHDELATAQEAIGKDPSEANIQRFQAARDNVAFWDGMTTLGRAGAVTHLGLGAKMQRTPVRPDNLDEAEAMQMSLMQKLAPKTPARRRPKK